MAEDTTVKNPFGDFPKAPMTEAECRKLWQEEAKQQTLESLPAFLKKLSEFQHDYGTICVALGAAAVAAAWAVERGPSGGITGFQAGAVMWEMIEGWGAMGEGPKRLVQYSDMLYPQYNDKFQKVITKDVWKWLQERAKEELEKTNNPDAMVSSSVRQHWQYIVDGAVPFGYTVVERI